MSGHAATTLNLASLLDQAARLRPDQSAVVCGDARLSYAQLHAAANQLAGGMAALGLRPGDRVALSCPNTPHFLMAYFGLLKAGAAVVPLNVLQKPREIAYHLKDSDAKALLVFEGTVELPMAAMAQAARAEAPSCEHLIVMTSNPAAPSPVEGAPTLGQTMHGRSPVFETHAARPDDTAVMLYTSGTTGQPKGAELSHFNMVLNALTSREALSALHHRTLDVQLVSLPLFHSTGQTCQMNAGVSAMSTLVLLPRFDPAMALSLIQRERVSFWVGVPTMYWALLQQAMTTGVDLAPIREQLRMCASGGAPMPVELMRQFESAFGVRILEGYGLSETSPLATLNHPQRPSRAGSVGHPVIGVEVRVVDERDQPVPAGTPGEVVIRGPNIMKGYYKQPDATAAAMRGGWFHTGDIGVLDEDGYLSIVDRKKDMILRGGLNVYPRELEEVLMTHPDVSLVAVIGVPDERLGEEIKAFIVPRGGARVTELEMVAWCREQFAGYKYPRIVEFRDVLPLGPTGKVLKRELRARVG